MKRELAHDENRTALGFDPSHVLTGEAKASFWLGPPLIRIHRELCHRRDKVADCSVEERRH